MTINRLIAYYSRRGENFANGKIVSLPVGNTEVIAKMIQERTGADLFPIDTVKSYPADYKEATEVARQELSENARPTLTSRLPNMAAYNVIYLGYPNWWGTMPMAIFTFLESYDFSGKIISPFCTHEGSGMGRSEDDIRRLCPKAHVTDGLPIQGSDASVSAQAVAMWLGAIPVVSE